MLRIVHTGCGTIEGIAAPEPEITVFRGIPFAAPPVGDLRWRAPPAGGSLGGHAGGARLRPRLSAAHTGRLERVL